MVAGCPRQAALACQSSLVCSATVTFLPPLARVAPTLLADNRQKVGTTGRPWQLVRLGQQREGHMSWHRRHALRRVQGRRGTCWYLGPAHLCPPACDASNLPAHGVPAGRKERQAASLPVTT
jgi:hypothetical protein